MPYQQTSDIALPNIVCGKPRVIVKFTADDCPVCQRLIPGYKILSDQNKYSGITFLMIDAAENPVSSKEVMLTGTAFMATYRNGVLDSCKLVSEEEEIVRMLDKLLE